MQLVALVVEDDPALRLIYRRILIDCDFEVLEAGDGIEALEILKKHTPHLVFLDMLLPRMNGQHVLEYLNTASHLSKTYVAVVSSNLRFEALVENSSLREFILKPIRPAQIRELIQRVAEVMV